MFHSAEIRWFFEGGPDAGVRDWFEASALKREEAPRVDSYLVLPGCQTCGVKIRQGHFEVKAQTSPPEIVRFGNGITGSRTAWVKWSSEMAGAPIVKEQQGPETWVQVEKSRTLRLFDLADRVEEKPASVWLSGPGCHAEFSLLRVAGDSGKWGAAKSWWSVCLEAFGSPEDVLDHLDKMAASEVLQPLGAALPAAASMSYPEWLVNTAT